MKEVLKQKLLAYLAENNPEIIISLDHIGSYLEEKVNLVDPLLEGLIQEGKPPYIIEEMCMHELTRELRPSRYNYLTALMEEEFEQEYVRLQESGLLLTEVSHLLSVFGDTFDAFGFREGNEDSKDLYYTLTGKIKEYLESQ
jgi:hypothetical protein